MFSNHLKISLRHLWSNKTFSLLNLIGLTTGIACAAFILLWVENELTANMFHEKADRIYKILNNQSYEGKTYTFSAVPGPLRQAILDEIPGVEHASRVDWGDQDLVSYDDKHLYEWSYGVEPAFFDIFSFPLIRGDKNTVFEDLHSIVITESFAERLFGDEDPMGKVVTVDKDTDFKVTGLIADVPKNSRLDFTFLKPFEHFEKRNSWTKDWNTNGMQTFVTLKPKVNSDQVNQELDSMIVKRNAEFTSRLFLFALKDWRLRTDFQDGVIVGGRIEHVRLFTVIAAFILLIACINFMNLSTARSGKRAREVGVRKVMGENRFTLIRQFLGEGIILSMSAVLLAVLAVQLLLPAFNRLVDEELTLRLNDPAHLGGLLATGFITGLLAGSYPSFYLSAFRPINVIKGMGAFAGTSKGISVQGIRKSLVVFQFAISTILIISTLVMIRQIEHVKDRRLGFDKENLMSLLLRGTMNQNFNTIRQDLLSTGVVENATKANQSMLELGNSSGDFDWQGKDPNYKLLVTTEWVSPEYVSTVGMKIVEGRDFNPDFITDSSSVLVNETFAKIMSEESVVGKQLKAGSREFRIVGVVGDFLFNDMYGKPDPVIFYSQPSSTNRLFIRLKSGQDVSESIAAIEAVLKRHNPEYPFEYRFVDESYDRLFHSESLISSLARLFAGLAILISCLGLFGLAAYTAEQRTKEIGIRKVLGATTAGIIGLLTSDFLRLVLIGLVISVPVAYFVMNKWLQGYAYRIDLPWYVFLIAGGLAVFVAFLTVSAQSLKAALTNPVESLRSE